MITIPPALAPVRPRVYGPESSEALPLDEAIAPFVEAGTRGAIRLIGSATSGKTTALADLAARVPRPGSVAVAENPDPADLGELTTVFLVVYTAPIPCAARHLAEFHLASWGMDEWIEYLLATNKERCASVLARLQAQRVPLHCDSPAVWHVVLDEMAAEEALPDARAALLRHVRSRIADDDLFRRLERLCLCADWTRAPLAEKWARGLAKRLGPANIGGLLRHEAVRAVLAVDLMLRDLRSGGPCRFLAQPLARGLVRAAASLVRIDERAQERLRWFLTRGRPRHPMAASLLHQAGTGWVPGRTRYLTGSYLDGAAWPEVDLSRANLERTDLSGAYLPRGNIHKVRAVRANLARARLDGATAVGLDASGANLTHASLRGITAGHARFDGADLSAADLEDARLEEVVFTNANLSRASFCGAMMHEANLTEATIEGADFSAADLSKALLPDLRLREATFTGACFRGAYLRRCDLEYMDLAGVPFEEADLTEALLTGCNLQGADFTGARLCNAGLADINAEGACLRGADLRGASFHMGTTRSGMLFSPYPCEGSKMGFYTDDSEEQHFKAPEEIRKGNLRGADLRGAQFDGVDFYLVDLRDALFDPDCEDVLRRTGAILEDWR